jgi:hypothetical protein
MLWKRFIGDMMLDQKYNNDIVKFEEKLKELRVSL